MNGTTKKWIAVGLLLLLLCGCSWRSVRDWLDKVDWERSDRPIHMIDIVVR